MAFSHGSIATLEIDPLGGSSYTNVSTYFGDINEDINTQAADTTTLGNTAKQYIPGLDDGKMKLKGLYDPSIDSTLESCRRKLVTFRYRPAGAGAGLPQHTGQALMSSYTIDTSATAAAKINAEFTINGAVTRTTQ